MTLFNDIENDAKHAFENINWEQAGETALRGAVSGFKENGVEGAVEGGLEGGVSNVGEQFFEHF